MQFDSLAALLQMGGHGPYVWSAYGISLLVLLVNALLPGWRRAAFLREVQGESQGESQGEAQSQEGQRPQ